MARMRIVGAVGLLGLAVSVAVAQAIKTAPGTLPATQAGAGEANDAWDEGDRVLLSQVDQWLKGASMGLTDAQKQKIRQMMREGNQATKADQAREAQLGEDLLVAEDEADKEKASKIEAELKETTAKIAKTRGENWGKALSAALTPEQRKQYVAFHDGSVHWFLQVGDLSEQQKKRMNEIIDEFVGRIAVDDATKGAMMGRESRALFNKLKEVLTPEQAKKLEEKHRAPSSGPTSYRSTQPTDGINSLSTSQPATDK